MPKTVDHYQIEAFSLQSKSGYFERSFGWRHYFSSERKLTVLNSGKGFPQMLYFVRPVKITTQTRDKSGEHSSWT